MDIDKMFKLPAMPAGGMKRKMPNAPTPGMYRSDIWPCPALETRVSECADCCVEMLKRFRVQDPEPEAPRAQAGANGNGKARAAHVDDEEEDGPAYAEGMHRPILHDSQLMSGSADEPGEEDDEDGRFFGGGLNNEQQVCASKSSSLGRHAGGSGVLLINPLPLYCNVADGCYSKSSTSSTRLGMTKERYVQLYSFKSASDRCCPYLLQLTLQSATLTLPALRRQLARFERIVAKNAEQRGKFPDDPSRYVHDFRPLLRVGTTIDAFR